MPLISNYTEKRDLIHLTALLVAVSFLAGCTPSIHDVVARQETDQVNAMLMKNPGLVHTLDGKQKTPLHAAVTYRKMDVMPVLLEYGADINRKDITGMTPLHVAAMLGRTEAAQWLLEHGADPEIEDNFSDTPLHTAVVFGRGQIIKILTSHGIAPDSPNGKGETPIAIAKTFRQDKVAKYLEYLSNKEIQ